MLPPTRWLSWFPLSPCFVLASHVWVWESEESGEAEMRAEGAGWRKMDVCFFLGANWGFLKLMMPRQFLPMRAVEGGICTLALFEDFGGVFLSGGYPFASGPSTGVDRVQVCAAPYWQLCRPQVGIYSKGSPEKMPLTQPVKMFNSVYWELRKCLK